MAIKVTNRRDMKNFLKIYFFLEILFPMFMKMWGGKCFARCEAIFTMLSDMPYLT